MSRDARMVEGQWWWSMMVQQEHWERGQLMYV